MHWILIGIGLIILRVTEPMFGMFLSEISWFVFAGLFIYLGFALNNLQTSVRELQIRQRELLLELKRVSKTTLRAVQTLDYSGGQDVYRNDGAFNSWLSNDDDISELPAEFGRSLSDKEWSDWLAHGSAELSNFEQEGQAAAKSYPQQ